MGLLTSLFRAATPENPSFGINSAEAWETFLGDNASASGVNVNRDKALTYSPWWRGITLIASTVAKLPLHIYRRNGDGKDRATEHAAYHLLRRQPNPYQTAFVFRQQLMGHALSSGNGYAYIERLGGAEPDSLWPLDPDNVTPMRKNGRKVFEVASEGRSSILECEEVIHIPGFGYDGLQGYSVVEKARDSLGLGIALRNYGAKYFKNAARPATVLETPTKLEAKAAVELRDSWERMHGGLDNAHKTAVLHSGLVAKILSFNAKDSQFIEERQFEIRDVANWLGVPPHKIGDTTRTAYASLEQENQSFLDDCIDAWLVLWEEETWVKLLTAVEKEADSHVIEFLREALVRANLEARANYYRAATGGRPWLVPDEVRGKENMNPLGGEAAEYMNPLNMGTGGQDNEPEDKGGPMPGNPKDNQALLAAHREILADAVGRLVRRIGAQAEKAAKDCQAFETWVGGMKDEYALTTDDALLSIDRVCELIRGDDRQGCAAAWILPAMFDEYNALLDSATAKTVAGDVAKLNARLAEQLPIKAGALFLGDECSVLGERPPRPPVFNISVNNTPAQVSVTTPAVTANINTPDIRVDAPVTINVPKQPSVIQVGPVSSLKSIPRGGHETA